MLGVPRSADSKVIRDAFRRLALQYHPDRNKEPDSEERFKEIAEAYAILSDPKKRADYDSGGFASVAGMRPEDVFGGIDFGSIFGDLGFGTSGGLFERFFGPRRSPARRGVDIEIAVRVSLETIARGGEQRIRYERPDTCSACGGSGAKAGTAKRPCPSCGGSGERISTHREQGVTIRRTRVCSECRGSGHVIDNPCPACGGRGSVVREESLVVTIPVGAEEGLTLRIPGKGYASKESSGVAGDLRVIVQSAPDPRFARNGADLWREERIDVADAVLGTELRVPALAETLTVRVPPGMQPDAQLRLRGKGLPHFGARARGDFYLRLVVRLPERPGAEERKLWEGLRALHRGAHE